MHSQKPRSEPRTKVLIRARLRGAGPEREACILDVSSRGLLITCNSPPARGAFVELLANGRSLVGHVKWSSGRRFGTVLHDRISVPAFVANRPGEEPQERKSRVARQRASSIAAVASDTSSLARFLTFAALALAALLAGLALMRSTQAAMGSFDKVNTAITAGK